MRPSKNFYYKLFTINQITDKYLDWLNDEETNQYSMRRFYRSTRVDAERFINSLNNNEYMYAIYTNNHMHVGNIHLGPIDMYNLNCEIRILIGDKNFRNKGVGAEAIYQAEKLLFFEKNIYRIGADSFNPAFEKVVVNKLGWRIEGCMQQRMLLDGNRYDYKIYGILANEFKVLPEFE